MRSPIAELASKTAVDMEPKGALIADFFTIVLPDES
jgi:hypothetical protein